MSKCVLGLDLGTTSIGWALVDEDRHEVVASGVRVFPEGVDRDQQGGEKSKCAARRTSRGMRRQIARRAARLRQLRDALCAAGLLPAGAGELDKLIALNPYALRARALDAPLAPFELGRVLLHLGRRRGFQSNRKSDKARASETSDMLARISGLANAIEGAGCRTLGEYLAGLDADFEHTRSLDADRVRHRHTRRDMYEQEFDTIWQEQQPNHPSILTHELETQLKRIIFFQRKMYWPKSTIGRCELEPKCRRSPRADRAAQRFRMLQEVNNLRILDITTGEERSLAKDERSELLAYLGSARQRTFDQIRKKLGLGAHVRFNYERADRNKLKGHETDAALGGRKALGKRWKELPAQTKDVAVGILLEEEQEHEALRRLIQDCGLKKTEAERALAVNLPDGQMSYSREAIGKLLPHLERGLLLMAEDASNSAIHAADYLRPDERVVRPRRYLPQPPDLPNPIVRQALVEARKLVNAVIREYGCPDQIHVELAREAKKSLEERSRIRMENATRRRDREWAAAEVQDSGAKPTRAAIARYLLWREQQESCVYCGGKISQAQLLGGEADIDHILPRWRSLDDSLANKLVCHRACNSAKGDRTPREWLETGDPKRYELVLRRAENLPFNKRRKFIQEDVVLDDFVNRQLTDTAYSSRCVTQYLKCLGSKIVTPRGQMTADLRYYWGLNTILDADGRGEKNRADHRHHAIDAIVIALTDHRRLHALANARGRAVPVPWDGFRHAAEKAMGMILVSFRVQRRLSGALHEETFYGATQRAAADDVQAAGGATRRWASGWIEVPGIYVRRKPVTEIKNRKHLDKVRDVTIRDVLRKHLHAQNVDADQSGNYPAAVFKGEHAPRMPSGVPIKKVRMLEESETFRPVSRRRSFQYVKPGRNHHVTYRANGRGADEKWTAKVTTMWDAAVRARTGRPVTDRTDNADGRFVMSLCIGESFIIDDGGAKPKLCVVRKMDQRSNRLHYKLHTDARRADDINMDNLYLLPEKMRLLNARKVTVDLLGRIRRAHD